MIDISDVTQHKRTFNVTLRPNVTSPDTVKWSSSSKSGMLANRSRKSFTCKHNFHRWLRIEYAFFRRNPRRKGILHICGPREKTHSSYIYGPYSFSTHMAQNVTFILYTHGPKLTFILYTCSG